MDSYSIMALQDKTIDVLESWGYPKLHTRYVVNGEISGADHRVLFVVSGLSDEREKAGRIAYKPEKTKVAVLSNGDIVTYTKKTEKSGQTFTGDRFIDSYSETYTIKAVICNSDLLKEWVENPSSVSVASVAVDLASEIIDIHESSERHA